MIEKILLADSGTGQTEEMLKMLMDIPLIQRAKVTVLHVVPPQVTAEGMTEKWEEGGKTLARAIQTLKLDPSHVTAMLREGDPKDVVCRVAEEIDTDLIIMGSRGLKRIQSILENSVSQYVFQLSSRPMLLVKDDIYVRKINRIMVAMDKSESAQQGLKLALALLRDIKNGQLILVHTNPDLKLKPGEISANPNEDPVLIPAANEAKKLGISYKCVAPEGKPGERICQVAEELNVDLLILGSPDRRPSIARGLPDLDRLLGQSLSDYVRVYANCPVLLVRSPAA
ncbi:MAG: universal stress protein [Synechococcales cyanobacterium C42_A2020_086]|jgi:nucleotide-binding universal stress UspA family protein|nr:universal stress protein [Synechococcales cyanobacterium M58_A2018_015]MBF2075771.1 universal stress protein [Synechococcales cyanobacterium C42_A2020_086]